MKPVVMGTVGLGNYAGAVCKALQKAAGGSPAPIRLAGVCEPDLTSHAAAAAVLRESGVRVVEQYEELLTIEEIEAVWIPLPIDLHRSFVERALSAGKAVICEKPAAGSVQDVDAMIAARDHARLPVAIGFQRTSEAATAMVKRRILDGAIGQIRSASVVQAGPRGDKYFQRSQWAGRFRRENAWVMDSVAMNAHAHGIHQAMFLCGSSFQTAATPVHVAAELYRTNPIENFDTMSMRLKLDIAADLLVLQTHACEFFVDELIVIEGESGRIYSTRNTIMLEPRGKKADVYRTSDDPQHRLMEIFARAVRGLSGADDALATLETARAHVMAVNGASEATPIFDTTGAKVRSTNIYQGACQAIVGMEAFISLCARKGVMLHESELFTWTRPAGTLDLHNYRYFNGPARALAGQTATKPTVKESCR